MARPVAWPEVGLGLDDSPAEGCLLPAHETHPEQVTGDLGCGPGVEAPRERPIEVHGTSWRTASGSSGPRAVVRDGMRDTRSAPTMAESSMAS